MTPKTAFVALLAMAGGAGLCLPATAGGVVTQTASETDPSPANRSFTNRVWVKQDAGDDRPGVVRIFLSDGTLMQDSCWETHRLSAWRMSSPAVVTWNEDGTDISADIVSVSADRLVLSIQLLGGETVEERYAAADVPYVCPDMPR